MVSEDDADNSVNSVNSASPVEPSVSWAPKLSKAGYYTTPSLEELNGYSANELSNVEGFSITRSGVGTIRWNGPVDLAGVDLDRTVVLEQGYASVYDDCEEGESGVDGESDPYWGEEELKEKVTRFSKPPRGEKLNVPATVTMHGIFPKAGSSAQRVRAYPAKVESRTNALQGATFLSYSLSTGDWVFATEGW